MNNLLDNDDLQHKLFIKYGTGMSFVAVSGWKVKWRDIGGVVIAAHLCG